MDDRPLLTAALSRLPLFACTMRSLSCLLLLSALSASAQKNQHRRLAPNHKDHGDRRQVSVPLPQVAEDHRVKNLPLLDDNTPIQHYAGLLPASPDQDKYFFYWFFYPDLTGYHGANEDIPLLIWLNGGPGCSSMDGLFLEHGPIQLTPSGGDWKLTLRDSSWHRSPAYVVYVDQPVGTGLSFTTSGKYPKNDEQVNIDFYYWLKEFLLLHAEVLLTDDNRQMKRPLYFSGESHAGHYIPSMMAYILKQNQGGASLQISLSGAAIGNGWVDPYYQYAAAEAAYGHGLIGRAQQNALDQKELECRAKLIQQQYNVNVCFELLDQIVDQSHGKTAGTKVSQYDIRQQESKYGARTFPPGHKDVEAYLGGFPVSPGQPAMKTDLSQVLAAIHATPSRDAGQKYQECTDPPYNALAHQDGLGVVPDVMVLLDNHVRLLFFNGIMDLICNHVGNEIWLENVEWARRNEWIVSPRYAWQSSINNKVAGFMKEYENLYFLKLLDSGHMVPLDVPDVALDMMRLFMYNKSFDTSKQELGSALPTSDKSCPQCPVCPSPSSSGCPICPAPTPSSAADIATPTQDDSVLKFVIAHSWIGAVVAVVIFLGFCACLRRRSNGLIYSDVEMKDTQYRDEPGIHYRDEDEETNGNGVI